MRPARTARWICTTLVVTALALAAPAGVSAAVTLPNGSTLDKIDFEQHIMGLFGRLGCNSGSCHGSFQGKGGLRLSLFGYEPDKDYMTMSRDVLARRVNPAAPEQSLLLLKAMGHVEHGGGARFQKDSWQYQVFLEWIKQGATWTRGSGEIQSVAVTPAEAVFAKPGETLQLKVTANFTGGIASDITPFCDYRTNDDAVAEVTNLGQIKAVRAGSTAIVVTYRGNVVPVRVLVPMELAKGFQYPKVPEVNYIDREVFSRLRRLNMVPSDLSSDEEFLRRVTIDTIGSLPTPAEVRAFLKDTDASKRTKKIDELLKHPLHAALWATKFCDITGNDTVALENPAPLKPKRSQMWHDWFRKRVAENMPYDQIVKGVLVATSRGGRSAEDWAKQAKLIEDGATKGFEFDAYANEPELDLFWRRQVKVPIEQWGEKTAAAFMGVRLECAQCHKHPFDRWTQAEYRAYANVFTQVNVGVAPETKKALDAINAEYKKGMDKNKPVSQLKELYIGGAAAKPFTHPDTNESLPAKAPGGPVIKVDKSADARLAVWQWLREPNNPFFARSFVNRIWGHYLGVGVVQPVDDFSLANPASNDKLLDALAKDFIEHNYDIRHLERQVLLSRVYQLSSKANETNKFDTNNYARSYVRPMMAEAVVDVINAALDVTENFGATVRTGSRALEVGPSQVVGAAAYAFRVWGRPARTAACDCERTSEQGLPNKLYMMTDTSLLQKVNAPDSRLVKLLKTKMSDDEVLDELFLGMLTRLPTESDRKLFREHRQRAADRAAAFRDVVWALLNTREFILNH